MFSCSRKSSKLLSSRPSCLAGGICFFLVSKEYNKLIAKFNLGKQIIKF